MPMRCVVCDFCEETNETPTNNRVILKRPGPDFPAEPVCLACLEEIAATNAEFEHEYINSGEIEPPLPEMPEQ